MSLREADMWHIEHAALDVLQVDPGAWYDTGDVRRIVNAERQKRGKPDVRNPILRASLQRLAKRGAVAHRRVEDDGRVRLQWRIQKGDA